MLRLEENNRRDVEHLYTLIGRRNKKTPNFALLIGAGASVSSGVKKTSEMIDEWRRQLHRQSRSKEQLDVWLSAPGQEWFEDEDEYSILFEKVCDARSQRRTYIENCVSGARPSWGYIYLANIICHNYFNVVFTPNFDDLLNEACFIYADLRPIVCAHDSAVADVRVTSARPKIIKLHGDFLYDSIKNTIRETENLEENMRRKFKQFAGEYGLVVIGYGGNDNSIMDVLDILLKSHDYFPSSLYWCLRNKDRVNKKVTRLLQRENTHWVEIDGFDEFMAGLHRYLKLELPKSLRDPYKATTEKLNSFIRPIKEPMHPIIKEDCKMLEGEIKKFERIISGKASGEESSRLIPYDFLGDVEFNKGNYSEASSYYEKALDQDPTELYVVQQILYSYLWTEDLEKILEIRQRVMSTNPRDFLSYYLPGACLGYLGREKDALATINKALKYAKTKSQKVDFYGARSNIFLIGKKWRKALTDANKALQIDPEDIYGIGNKCLALKKLGRIEEARKLLLETLPKVKKRYHRAFIYAALDDKKNMLKELTVAIEQKGVNRVMAKFDPDFVDYQEDPDFRNLVYGKEKKE